MQKQQKLQVIKIMFHIKDGYKPLPNIYDVIGHEVRSFEFDISDSTQSQLQRFKFLDLFKISTLSQFGKMSILERQTLCIFSLKPEIPDITQFKHLTVIILTINKVLNFKTWTFILHDNLESVRIISQYQ